MKRTLKTLDNMPAPKRASLEAQVAQEQMGASESALVVERLFHAYITHRGSMSAMPKF